MQAESTSPEPIERYWFTALDVTHAMAIASEVVGFEMELLAPRGAVAQMGEGADDFLDTPLVVSEDDS